MLKIFNTMLSLMVLGANTLFATTYYVSTTGNNSNIGTSGSPWLNIGVSIAKLHAGDTLIVTAGTYVETSAYTFNISGTTTSPITIIGQNAIVDMHVTGGQLYNFNGNYVVVDGLKFKMTLAGGMVSGGVLGINGNNCIFKNIEIYDIAAAIISGNTGDQLYCVVSGGGSSFNTCSNLLIHDIKDGDIFRIWGYTNKITSCTVSNCSNPNYNYSGSSQLHADLYQSFGDNNTPSVGNIMENNYWVNNSMQFVTISQDSRSNIHDNVWRNNIFVNIATCSFMGQRNTFWYNNLFINVGANPGCALRLDGGTDAAAGWDAAGSQIINNAFIRYSINFMGGLSASQFIIANNYYGTASFGALGAIGTSAVNGGDPQFTDTQNYHLLATSVFRGAGMNLTGNVNGPTTDKDGNPRPLTGSWDIGPYQYTSALTANPIIAVSPISLAFGAVLTNQTSSQTVTIQNANGGILTGEATASAPFTISNGNYSLGLGQSQTITVIFSPTTLGLTNQIVTFTATGGVGTNLTVSGIGTSLVPTVSAISANMTNASPLSIYAGTAVALSAVATNSLTWQWSYAINGGSSLVFQSGSGSVSNAIMSYDTNSIGSTYVWTLTVSNGQQSAQSQFTLNVLASSAAASGLTFAAASGIITPPFVVGSSVVGGVTNSYISQPVQTTVVSNAGSATFNFTITNAGKYGIQALVNAPNTGANSFYVNIDAQPQDPAMIWDVPITLGFEQRLVSWRGAGTDSTNQFIPMYFNLTAGPHQIIFCGREPNAQLSSFSILQAPQPPTGLKTM